jgi:hypothetical protein
MIFELLQHQAYRMVYVSAAALFIYLFCIFIYQVIYPKKKIPYIVLLLGFSILPVLSILRKGIYESGDLSLHAARAMDFYTSLENGILIPRWASELNATYGYALFQFIYPLPYYIISLFHLVGFGFIDSVKMLLITMYLLSGITMFYWLRRHVKEKNGFLGSLFYLFAPYHFVDLHFRIDIGEVVAFVLLPLILLLIDVCHEKKSIYWYFVCGFSIALLVLSHPAISMYGLGLVVLYVVFALRGTVQSKITLFSPVILGVLFSAFYWIPVIAEKSFAEQSVVESVLEFPTIKEYIYSPWRYGFLFQGPMGELSFVLGYGHWLVTLIALYSLIFKKTKDKNLLFFTIIFLACFFVLQKLSKPLWDNIFLLKSTLLPYRLLVIVALATSAMSAFLMNRVKSKVLYCALVILVICTSILNWGNRRMIPEIGDREISSNLPLISSQGECFWPAITRTKTSTHECEDTLPSSHIEVLDGKSSVLSEKRSILVHSYHIVADEESRIRENTHYFPGWKLLIDGKEKEIISDDGVITFTLEKGVHDINLTFEDTPVRRFALAISIVALLISGGYLLWRRSY